MQYQPYRQGPREPGAALTNMLRGRTLYGYNPKDAERGAALRRAARKARPDRPPRPARPQRPPR